MPAFTSLLCYNIWLRHRKCCLHILFTTSLISCFFSGMQLVFLPHTPQTWILLRKLSQLSRHGSRLIETMLAVSYLAMWHVTLTGFCGMQFLRLLLQQKLQAGFTTAVICSWYRANVLYSLVLESTSWIKFHNMCHTSHSVKKKVRKSWKKWLSVSWIFPWH